MKTLSSPGIGIQRTDDGRGERQWPEGSAGRLEGVPGSSGSSGSSREFQRAQGGLREYQGVQGAQGIPGNSVELREA